MFFYMPSKVYSEENCVKNHGTEMSGFGKKALIVTGKSSSAKNGSLNDVKEALVQNGVPYAIFNRIEENPSVETVMQARAFGLSERADFVIGVGGGSPMDAAKAISLMMKHPEKDEAFLFTPGDDSAYPVVTVPTTCGTGSEATPFAVLTVHERNTKSAISHRIFPELSLVDGRYLSFAPKSVLISTSIDALGHFVESFINTTATEFSRLLCREGLRIWAKTMSVVTGEKEAASGDYEDMMNASTVAGMAISHTGTALPHGLSYYLTYEDGVPHGKAVGVFLPGYMQEADTELSGEILDILGMKDLKEFHDFIESVLRKVEITDALKEKALDGLLANKAKLKNCPYPVDRRVLEHIFP